MDHPIQQLEQQLVEARAQYQAHLQAHPFQPGSEMAWEQWAQIGSGLIQQVRDLEMKLLQVHFQQATV